MLYHRFARAHEANQERTIAQQEGGATVIDEHRFCGLRNLYSGLSVQNFSVHTFVRTTKNPIPFWSNFGPNVEALASCLGVT